MTMTRRDRMMATLRGEPVDHPAVSFYEIGGFSIDRTDPSPFNIFNSPDWFPLLDLAESQTELIRMTRPSAKAAHPEVIAGIAKETVTEKDGSRFHHTTYTIGGRTLTYRARRDQAVQTTWTLEHLLKDADDVAAYLQLPDSFFERRLDMAPMAAAEAAVGDRGIVMVDTPDPICQAACLFSMEDYTVTALTEPATFHRLLEKMAAPLWRETEEIAARFPGRLWRIYGPEFASEPYLPPSLFEEYVCRYTEPMVRAIQKHGGYARLHCHGRLKNILPLIAGMGAVGLDPIEPPPQGDLELSDVRREVGRQMVLFGNIEASDIENLAPRDFEKKVRAALEQGTAGEGRGYVLMPSASPYGRTLTPHTLDNYRTMVRLAQAWG